ncbi:chondroitinase-B domain-containing protein, partial [Vibrio owensii]
LAGVVAASISALTLVGCNTSPSQTTEAAAPAVVETAVNDITRDYLLATDRLNTVDGSALEAQSADAVQALKQQMENAEDGTTITIPAGKYADLDIVTVKANDITIKAEQPGSVWLTGLAQLRLEG